MTVYVDPLIAWPQKPSPGAERWFGNGKVSCHLMADTERELHEFALRIGLKRQWFQSRGSIPHYDLTPKRRALAVRAGAREITIARFLLNLRLHGSGGEVERQVKEKEKTQEQK